MTREELINQLNTMYKGADVSKISGLLAIQINLTDTEPNVMYIEVKDGVLTVMPYEYIDHQAILGISTTDMLALADGKLDPIAAFLGGKITVDGDKGKALELKNIVPQKAAAPKTATPKADAPKANAPKAAAKKAKPSRNKK